MPRREDLIDPLWNELVSVVEDPWLAFDTGDPVNFFSPVNEMNRSPTGHFYDVSTLAVAPSADDEEVKVALRTLPHYISTSCLSILSDDVPRLDLP